MLKNRINTLVALTFIASLLVTACGGNDAEAQAIIQTSVAQTVAAQAATEEPATETPAATLIPTQTPFSLTPLPSPIPSPTSFTPAGSQAQCASASLQDEAPVDGKIFKPGVQFVKTWYVKNTSPCVWDTTYKIVFWSGDLLGGGYVYQLPRVTGPGQTVPIELVLTTPTTPGTYKSEWKLQTPDNINFGVGYLQAALYTEIVVSAEEKPVFGITSVVLEIDREPDYGCAPANIDYWAVVTITTNGPIKIKYQIIHSDGGNGPVQSLETKEATKIVLRDHRWRVGRANSQNDNRWMQFVVTQPNYYAYDRVGFEFFCP
jgi:hypothetical protein